MLKDNYTKEEKNNIRKEKQKNLMKDLEKKQPFCGGNGIILSQLIKHKLRIRFMIIS